MFANLISLILVLLLISLSPEGGSYLIASPWLAFSGGMLLYAVFLLGMIAQCRFFSAKRALFVRIGGLELLLFFALYHFLLGAQRLFGSYLLFSTLYSLSLYFFGLWTLHAAAYGPVRAEREVRMLAPFVFPFLLFTLLAELAVRFPVFDFLFAEPSSPVSLMASFAGLALFLLLVMLLLPPLIQLVWNCQPLADSGLRDRLEALCEKANFRCRGLRVWSAMGDHPTAGIIGIFPRFRYVMFTPHILRHFHEDEVEAILAHEIGHSAHRHLLLYPYLIFGMLLLVSLFSLLFSESIGNLLALKTLGEPSPLLESSAPLLLFLPYAAIIALYFRYVFGYFSRLFERQADLYGLTLGLSAQSLIAALDSVGIATGNTHRHPNWHHHSIEKRIAFLREAEVHPDAIGKHHSRVRRALALYTVAAAALFFVVFSQPLSSYPPFTQIYEGVKEASGKISDWTTRPLREAMAKKVWETYRLEGSPQIITSALAESYRNYGAARIPGAAEFYAARQLLSEGELEASAQLMIESWNRFDFREAPPEVKEEFRLQSQKILERLAPGPLQTQLRARMQYGT